MTDQTRRALPVAAFAMGMGASLAYVAQRIVEHVRSGPVDPTLVVFALHTSFYWRVMTASFWGGLFAIAAYAIARRSSDAQVEKFSVWVARSVVPFGLALAFASWCWP